MSQALQQSGGEASAPGTGRVDVTTAFGVYTALLDLAGPARARCGSDSLFAFYHYAGGPAGRGFRAGIPKAALACWARHTWQASGQDNPDGGEPAGLRVSSRCCPSLKIPMKAALRIPMWGCVKAPQPGRLRGLDGDGAGSRG